MENFTGNKNSIQSLKERLLEIEDEYHNTLSGSVNISYMKILNFLYDMELEIFKENTVERPEIDFIEEKIVECEGILSEIQNSLLSRDINAILNSWVRDNDKRTSFWHCSIFLQYLKYKKIKLLGISKDENRPVDTEDEKEQTIGKDTLSKKLKWIMKPSQFGFLMLELIDKGYIEKPAKGFRKTAEIFLEHFEIETTVGTLEKELNPTTNSMEVDNYRKIVIPKSSLLS